MSFSLSPIWFLTSKLLENISTRYLDTISFSFHPYHLMKFLKPLPPQNTILSLLSWYHPFPIILEHLFYLTSNLLLLRMRSVAREHLEACQICRLRPQTNWIRISSELLVTPRTLKLQNHCSKCLRPRVLCCTLRLDDSTQVTGFKYYIFLQISLSL